MNNNFVLSLPVLPLRGLVVFPDSTIQFDVGRSQSVNAVREALNNNRMIFLLTQRDLSDGEPTEDNLFRTGTVGRIRQIINDDDFIIRIQVNGLYRAKVKKFTQLKPFISCDISPVNNKETIDSSTEVIAGSTLNLYNEYLMNFRNTPNEFKLDDIRGKDIGSLADYFAANSSISYDKKQSVLEELNSQKRIELVNSLLQQEIQYSQIESEIVRKTQSNLEENQREYFLREQMHVIAKELGDDDSPMDEASELRETIESRNLPEETKTKLLKECDKLSRMPYGSHEASVIRLYIDTVLELPWDKRSDEKIDLVKAAKILDRDHYGLKKVKERFLEILAVRKLSGNSGSQIICLVGPPGVGKTSIARSIAEAIGRKYARVSLGGIQDEADIMGHRRTYVGSMPGRIINAIKTAGVNNPLILLDEVDKLGHSYKGDPSSSLLEILDSEQNKTFHDHYIDMPFDLSDVLFVTTANDASQIPGPLYDRMDVIELGSYTQEEKFHIAKEHLIPKQLKIHGIKASQLKFTPKGINSLIEGYTKEAGVRTLERHIASICRKTARMILEDENFERLSITNKNLEEVLGPAKYNNTDKSHDDEIGLVNGLAWTSVGGELLPIEVAVMPGTGKVQLTGSLGDVMKESANAALTCVRVMSGKLGIERDFYTKYDIHIHAPEGAVPKDGPSAGVAMATAITSALSNKAIKHDVAMTGEITIQGRVLPIGGLKEKSMAAYKNGIKTVLIPNDNLSDLTEVDDVVKQNVKFIPLKRIEQALDNALV